MFKRIHWLSFIPIFLALAIGVNLILLGIFSLIAKNAPGAGDSLMLLDSVLGFITVFVSFFVARGISRSIYDKLERKRWFKEHPEEDYHNR